MSAQASTPWGALFDWDGVVIDSSAAHERSWELLADEEKRHLPPGHFEAGFGRRNTDLIPNILGWSDDPTEVARLGDRKEELYREIIRAEGIAPLPGAAELIRWLKEHGVPCAVGTSTPRANVAAVLEVIGLQGCFQTLVAAENVAHGKPDPEVFVTGATR
ncbi:MAG: HAD family hydrolase, partial [Opitutales bacterium]